MGESESESESEMLLFDHKVIHITRYKKINSNKVRETHTKERSADVRATLFRFLHL